MKKLPALFSLATSIGLWYACTKHPQNKKAIDKSAVKISKYGVNITYTDLGKGDTTLLLYMGVH